MSRYYSYLNSTGRVISMYNGAEPFASFLKKYFSVNKKFGSRDRKIISNLCYCYFRLGKANFEMKKQDRILAGLFLCSNESNEILAALKPEWNLNVKSGVKKKYSIINDPHQTVGKEYRILNVFPWVNELSDGIEHEKFCKSFLVQPDLFIRLRPGKENLVKNKLIKAGIKFLEISESALSLPNTTKLKDVIQIDEEAVIQDRSSQQVGEFIRNEVEMFDKNVSVWDCCAASGGKSIMAYDINPDIQLTVSDVREGILENLKKRFLIAGIRKYKSVIIDLTKNNIQHPIAIGSMLNNQQLIIIADVPCSGSGTWSRTPEQLYYFDEKRIYEYASLQKKIISNVIPHLKPGGSLIYITCSVFKKENEEVAAFAESEFTLKLVKQEMIKGYDKKADSMFVALLRKDL